jgi:hypothetical protein
VPDRRTPRIRRGAIIQRAHRRTFSRAELARDHTVQPCVSQLIDIPHVAYLDNHARRRYPLVCLRIRQRRGQHGQAQLAAAGPPRVPGRRVARARLDLACERAGVAALQLQRGPVRRGPAPGSRHRRVRGRACARPCGGRRHVRRHGARRRPHGHDSNARRLGGDAPASRDDHGGQGRFCRRGRTGGHARVERDERVGRALRTPRDSPGFGRRRLPGS